MRSPLTTLALLLLAFSANAQVFDAGTPQNIDYSGKTTTKPVKSGTSLPATCAVGELYYKTDASAGANLYGCTATNTWTLQTGGAGGASASRDLTDLKLSVGSTTQLDFAAGALGDHDESFTFAAGYFTIQSRAVSDITEGATTTITTSVALGTGFHTGDSVNVAGVTGTSCSTLNNLHVITVTGASTFSVAVNTSGLTCANGTVAGTGNGTAYVYGRDDGEIVLEVPASSGVIATCGSGSCAVNQVTTPAFDLGIAPLATVTIASGAWSAATDSRTFLGKRNMVAGTGISISGDTVGIDTATIPQLGGTNTWTGANDASGASSTSPAKVGATDPATCAVGALFVNTTGPVVLKLCTATNTWSTVGPP